MNNDVFLQGRLHDVLPEIRSRKGTFSYQFGDLIFPSVFLHGIPLQKRDYAPEGYHHFVSTKLLPITKWVNENIVFNMDIDDYRTTGVKCRIATGMLNKVPGNKEFAILAHDVMIANVKKIKDKLIDEDLPF